MTGPRRGEIYAGTEVPVQQRVATNAMVAYNDAQIKFASQPNTAAATELLKQAQANDTGDGAEINKAKTQISQRLGLPALNQIIAGAAPAPAPATAPATAPAAPGAATGVNAQGQNVTMPGGVNPETGTVKTPTQAATPAPAPPAPAPAVAPTPARTPAAAPIYTPSVKRAGESENMYQSRIRREEAAFNAQVQKRKELEVAEEKPPAEARGKLEAKDINNQAFADSSYGLVRPIAALIKQSTGSGIGATVDNLAALIGQSTTGAQAIAQLEPLSYPLLANVPRFEGPQSDYDVKTYQKAAGDFANPEKPIATLTRFTNICGLFATRMVHARNSMVPIKNVRIL
jgi:hypothetical protein